MKKTTTAILAAMLFLTSSTIFDSETAIPEANLTPRHAKQHLLPLLPVFVPLPIAETVFSEQLITENVFIEEPIVDRQLLDKSNHETKAALNAYKLVLKDNQKLFRMYDPEYMNIRQCILTDSFTIYGHLEQFGVIDLDGDNLPEVILAFKDSNGNNYYYAILRFQHNLVYAYSNDSKDFNHLKIDGTFHFYGLYCGTGTISFNSKTSVIDHRTTYYSYTHQSGNYFVVNNKRTTEEEFARAMYYQDSKPDITWYEFSEDNIERCFSTE